MAGETSRVLVWDWALRLFHWAIVLLVGLMWWSAETDRMDLHTKLGMIVVGLVAFRIIWGVIGPPTARFATMIAGPKAIAAYVQDLLGRRHKPGLGHNPLGTLSVFALLLALVAQVGSGLFAVDVDGLNSGPLSTLVSFETGRQLAEIHELSFKALQVLVLLHLAAIVTYLVVFKDNLVRPMLTGRRARSDFKSEELPDNKASLWRVLLAVALAYGVMAAVWFSGQT